jgi:hypothetical protein
VIAAPHWRPFRLDAEDALLEQRVNPDGIRAMDRWLVHLERQKALVVTSEVALAFFGDSTSPTPIAKLLHALIAIQPTCLHIPAVSEAHLLRQRSYQPAKPERARSRTPKVSVERHELPTDWLGAIADMEAGAYRGCRPPAASIVATITMKLRQLGFSAQEAGLPMAFTVPALSAYVQAMIARELASSTIASTLGKLQTFAVYSGAPEETIVAIASERCFHERRAREDGKNKDRFLARSGLSIDDVAQTALDCYQKALEETNPRIRHMDWMRGALFAFVICRALRPLDVFGLVIGRTLQRDSEGWAIYARASKNRYRLVGRLWDICTPYLDGAILLGADESQLWAAYARAEGRPLLAERDGKALDENWATEQFRHRLGTGVGIMRTLWHDLCAAVGTEQALRTALAICGQHDPRTTQHYRTRMSGRSLMAQGQELLAQAAADVGE